MKTLLITAALVAAVSAHAVDIFNVNFEAAQGYSLGQLDGQNGWNADTRFTVATGPTGGQALQFNGDNSGGGWLDIPGGYTDTTKTLWAVIDVYLDSTTANNDRWYGMTMFGSNDIYGITLNSDGQVSAGNFLDPIIGGNIVGTVANPTNRWIKLGLGYDLNSTTLKLYFDGQTSAVNGLSFTSNAITDADFITLSGQDPNSTSMAYFDNYYVGNAAPVPEPASIAALGLGALALIRKKRKLG